MLAPVAEKGLNWEQWARAGGAHREGWLEKQAE